MGDISGPTPSVLNLCKLVCLTDEFHRSLQFFQLPRWQCGTADAEHKLHHCNSGAPQ